MAGADARPGGARHAADPVHLRPASVARAARTWSPHFARFCAGPARDGRDAVYMLGDLFDAWLGDDQLREPLAAGVAAACER